MGKDTTSVESGNTAFVRSMGMDSEHQMHVNGAFQAICDKHKPGMLLFDAAATHHKLQVYAAAASAICQGSLLHTEKQSTPAPQKDSIQPFLANTV